MKETIEELNRLAGVLVQAGHGDAARIVSERAEELTTADDEAMQRWQNQRG